VRVMSAEEARAFLAEGARTAHVATTRADGSPHVVPVWFIHERGKIFVTPRFHSEFGKNLRRDPRVAITIDEEALPYRKVLVAGRAETVHQPGEDDRWRELYRAIAKRYIDDEAAEHYVTETIDQPRFLLAVDLSRAQVTTWRMPVENEPYAGIWAKRYYLEGTKMRKLAEDVAGGRGGERS